MAKKVVVVGLCGFKGSGKTTCSQIIMDLFDHARSVQLAGRLKQVCAEVTGFSPEIFESQEFKNEKLLKPWELTKCRASSVLRAFEVEDPEKYLNVAVDNNLIGRKFKTPRAIMQYLGTELLRDIVDTNIHCKTVKPKEGELLIVSDIRFPNEIDYFAGLEGVTFLPLFIDRQDCAPGANAHSSEMLVYKAKDKCWSVPNNGSMEELESAVIEALWFNGLVG